ncbi:alpha/beta-hydrolase family protein [Nocardia puris]|uniref:Putative membrane protein n=2 Tax=Nocardia puris TaxID=208602 RepID=A0A366E3J1_9NOCA|nr:alpha/beta-hydrolase family protein [Nocardia puris]RBO96882.1 putative membrane protein [Nocardia puris]
MTTTLTRPHSGAAEPEREPAPRISLPERLLSKLTYPRVGTTLGAGAGVLISLAPGLLPRTPSAQGVLAGLLVALALGVVGVVRVALGRRGVALGQRVRHWRKPLALAAAVVVLTAAWRAGMWQNELRAAMGAAPIAANYWLIGALVASVVAGLLVGLSAAVRAGARRLGLLRSVVAALLVAAMSAFVLAPALAGWRQQSYAASNALFDDGVAQPVSFTKSGSAESEVSWDSLGVQGRRFVTGGPEGPVRVYVGMDSAPDLDSRVALVVRELERSGGLTRSNIVVAIPTGSGWIDANAVTGFAERFAGDVAVVGMQYSYAPSWVGFAFGRDEAVEAARALFTAVERRVASMDAPPKLFVYGQSLGASGGGAVFADAADQDRRTCAALWAGPPANDAPRAGATILSNSSDPVVHWSPALLWRAPDLTGVRRDAPLPPWLPGVSFVQTTADLLAALDAPPGHGHRYGTDQGTALGDC